MYLRPSGFKSKPKFHTDSFCCFFLVFSPFFNLFAPTHTHPYVSWSIDISLRKNLHYILYETDTEHKTSVSREYSDPVMDHYSVAGSSPVLLGQVSITASLSLLSGSLAHLIPGEPKQGVYFVLYYNIEFAHLFLSVSPQY